jgi:ribosomal protein S19
MHFKIYKYLFISKQYQKIKLGTRIFCRSSAIPKDFFRKTAYLYKGEIDTRIEFSKYAINYKFGEFSFSRKPFSFPQKKKKK